MNCRHCATRLEHRFLDLGFAPPSNEYLTEAELHAPEKHFPLRLFVCGKCRLVQTEDFARADELFSGDYAYFSSTSTSWLDHAKRYCAAMTEKLGLGAGSFVIEVASNDGYLLKNFVEANISCLGIEPTDSTAEAAEKLGIPVLRKFFGETLARELASQGKSADLIIGNNVYAHVPNINDFTKGLAAALKPDGTVTLEFPHLMRLIEFRQFDTVYHEHFSYLSLTAVTAIFAANGLRVFDVEELPTHGGSLRVYGCLPVDPRPATGKVKRILEAEKSAGLLESSTYEGFQKLVDRIKDDFVSFLIAQKRDGKKVAAYGAAAKGNTLINYAGVRPDLLPFVCDAAPSKQGKYLPGSHIPILHPQALREGKPDVVVILPWNIAEEVRGQHGYIAEWGGRFAAAIPAMRFLD